MDEIGADTGPSTPSSPRWTPGSTRWRRWRTAQIPDCVRTFVGHTLQLALHGAPHEAASSFCHGRENLLPDVFGEVRKNVDGVLANAPIFRHYLDRHIALDHDEHGPLALRLLAALCDGDPAREADAERVSVEAIEARIALWDGVLAEFAAAG